MPSLAKIGRRQPSLLLDTQTACTAMFVSAWLRGQTSSTTLFRMCSLPPSVDFLAFVAQAPYGAGW